MSIREIRQRWPEAEKALGIEREIIITRDGKPVARLLPLEEPAVPRKRFDPEAHAQWMKETWGDQQFDTLTPLLEDREDRKLL